MGLYKVSVGDLPRISDVNQFVDALSGANDFSMSLFAPVSAPAAPTLTAASGTGLGIGTYKYVLTYVTGYRKTNGTIVYQGETLISSSTTVVTTSGNQQVLVSNLPTTYPTGVIAIRIYRTNAGGLNYLLVYEMNTNLATYTDSLPDGSQTSVTPVTNTTGATLTFNNNTINGIATWTAQQKFNGGAIAGGNGQGSVTTGPAGSNYGTGNALITLTEAGGSSSGIYRFNGRLCMNVSDMFTVENTVGNHVLEVSTTQHNYNGNKVVDLSQFTQSFSGNGYVKLPNGLIINWQNFNIASQAWTQGTDYNFAITWATSFPTGFLAAAAVPTLGSWMPSVQVQGGGVNGCTLAVGYDGTAGTSAVNVSIIALGH